MKEVINIEELEVFGYHGTFYEEKVLGQKYIINLEVKLNEYFSAIDDDLKKTIDYVSLVDFIKKFFEENKRDLLETISNDLLCELFNEFKSIKEAYLEILKPSYHINRNFKGMKVCNYKKLHKVYIALGSNLGDRRMNMDNACKLLEENNISIINKSKIIETEPYGDVEQDNFLNSVIEISTILNPFELINLLLKIEEELKRERIIRWGPRTIDLDILLYDNEIILGDDLIIPHYDMHNREFVLEPLCDINKFAYNPKLQKFAFEMLNDLKKNTK